MNPKVKRKKKGINTCPEKTKAYNKKQYDKKLKLIRKAAGGKWWLEEYFKQSISYFHT